LSVGHFAQEGSEDATSKADCRFAAFFGALASSAHAADVGGTISKTLTIT